MELPCFEKGNLKRRKTCGGYGATCSCIEAHSLKGVVRPVQCWGNGSFADTGSGCRCLCSLWVWTDENIEKFQSSAGVGKGQQLGGSPKHIGLRGSLLDAQQQLPGENLFDINVKMVLLNSMSFLTWCVENCVFSPFSMSVHFFKGWVYSETSSTCWPCEMQSSALSDPIHEIRRSVVFQNGHIQESSAEPWCRLNWKKERQSAAAFWHRWASVGCVSHSWFCGPEHSAAGREEGAFLWQSRILTLRNADGEKISSPYKEAVVVVREYLEDAYVTTRGTSSRRNDSTCVGELPFVDWMPPRT